ncbi:MAG: CocE/NonD family hydrolase [Candidatus Tectomicrobia bacterium]|uniref:CocE/NonD family hydrolase n=1 Tax=Tectimicrobiota bacterium TaxID=2528274 RepID=A0A932HZ85_UNCTE|nr:CocE/NonD family hydrolase [Candidatus Tectomicrobia bacterium]
MRIDWDVPIQMDDKVVLRADVYRPIKGGKYPVIMTYGPYGKWLHFEDLYTDQWRRMAEEHPDVPSGSTNKYQNWEVVDPEKWVPDGYAVVRVDSRGAGRSPGLLDIWSAREAKDFHDCIEWGAKQPWSSGKVGLNGISYYAMNQWQVAALQPPHLAAICIWEGAADYYRDLSHHGGILCTFGRTWFPSQVIRVQHGKGSRGYRSRMNGDWVAGPAELTEEQLGASRRDFYPDCVSNPLATDGYWTSRMPDWSKVQVPLLSAGNWGGQGLHPRGNIEGFVRSASRQKWLEMHGIEHWTHFYTDYGVSLQKKFFGHFLKGEKTGWDKQPKVVLQVRHPGEKFAERAEGEWPLKRTKWTKFYLDPAGAALTTKAGASGKVSYGGLGEGVTFLTAPLKEDTEITGPIAAKLFVSSSTRDADLFLILRAFDPNMKEITFMGALDPHTPIAQGWLRASHRKLDKELSLPWRPYHTHDEVQPLKPGQVYELDVEVWVTSIVVPAGHRIGLTVRGKDYEWPGGGAKGLGTLGEVFTGVGPFKHDDPQDRPPEVFGGKVTIHAGKGRASHILLPVIPAKRGK